MTREDGRTDRLTKETTDAQLFKGFGRAVSPTEYMHTFSGQAALDLLGYCLVDAKIIIH